MTKAELCKSIYDIAHLTGTFTLRSGMVSNEYFDKYRFESDPTILRAVAEHMAALVPQGTELLAGLEMGGIGIVAALSLQTGIPAVFVRKEAKKYGTCQLAEGPSVDGRRVLVVEDVITSGGQVIISTNDLRGFGAIVTDCVAVIDREQGGRAKMAEAGIHLHAVCSMTELKAHV